MLSKTFIDSLVSDKHQSSVQEERRLNALYLAVINNPHAPADEQMAEANQYYSYLKAGTNNFKY